MIKNVQSYIMPTYGQTELEFVRGEGVYLYTAQNKKFLDFGSGIAVNSLGHCHPKLVTVLQDQASKLWHTSNLYYSSDKEKYAELLCKSTFAEQVFFTNSGTESIECGLKLIRSYHSIKNKSHKDTIITFNNSFHGRSIAAISGQNNPKYTKGFEPLLDGFISIPFNNLNILEKTINEKTSAIMIETIQGEGGVNPISIKILDSIKNLCLKKNILLFIDEVQCGFGRSGKLFSYQWSNIEPDLMAVAKGIGSGFPMGACLATKESAIGMTLGKHGSTYGGNPLAISVGLAVLEEINSKGFLDNIRELSNYLWKHLKDLENKHDKIIEVRGAGLLLGIKTTEDNNKICKLLEAKGLLTLPASDNVVRLAPPLIIKKKHIDDAIEIINQIM